MRASGVRRVAPYNPPTEKGRMAEVRLDLDIDVGARLVADDSHRAIAAPAADKHMERPALDVALPNLESRHWRVPARLRVALPSFAQPEVQQQGEYQAVGAHRRTYIGSRVAWLRTAYISARVRSGPMRT